ncbi:MAG TPA: hypothetical protein VMB50_00065 [Myxococcales bacterium]|nr:hypothetical protein [Myxococcales bacterium]
MTAPPDAEIAARLQAILKSDAFHKRVSDYLDEWLQKWIPGFLHWLRRLPAGTRWVLLAVCVLLLAAIAVQLYVGLRPAGRVGPRGARGFRPQDAGEEPGEIAARARALAAAAKWREAARALQQAALLRLSRERGLPWRAELADWEWVATLRDVRGLPEFTRAAQRLAYGPDPDAPGWSTCEALYEGLGG